MNGAIIGVLLGAATLAAPAYEIITRKGIRWRDGSIRMNLQLDATMPPRELLDGKTSWNAVAQEALDLWNEHLDRVQFAPFTDANEPGDGNDENEVFFSREVYGHQFGNRVLAITTAWRIRSERVEGDTIFNSDIDWDSYRGTLDFGLFDLRRVAAHEFGHTLGLDHPDQAGQVVVAMMNSVISDLDTLATDDIHGTRALYLPATTYKLDVEVTPPNSANIFASPAPDANGRYPAGTLVTLAAKPLRGFRFGFWGGDENALGKKLRVLVLDDETITANLSTNGAPVITTHPRSQHASIFDTIVLSVRVASGSPVTYQWQHNGVDLPDNDAFLVLELFSHEQSGLYSVRVINARGETHSKPALVIVDGY